MDDILYINKALEIKICENIKYKIKSYIWIDKILNLDNFIFQSEIYEDTKDTSKRILSIRKCNELQWWNSKKILNLLDDVNICELNSYILSIFFDNLLNEDSKISFEFFQVFHKIKLDCQLLFS